MNKVTRKLILSISACAMTLVCLTSTTYAWFSRNSGALINDFELEIQQHDGLVISVDGINYYQSIDNDTLLKAIVAKRLGKDLKDISNEELDGEINKFKNNKNILEPVSTYNLIDFTTVNSNSEIINGFYVPTSASQESYLAFDLYFRIDQSKPGNEDDYYLTFAYDGYSDVPKEDSDIIKNYNYINGVEQAFKLSNKLSDTTKDYNSGDEIKVNSRDAMRIGVLTYKKINEDKETTNESFIYEPYLGLGSYALEGEIDSNYNPNKNAMLTYFNNTHVDKLKPLEDKEHFDIYKNTEKDFNGMKSLGIFEKNSTSYEDVKITVFIWLEGYDSDFIKGFDDNKLTCSLCFIKEVIK